MKIVVDIRVVLPMDQVVRRHFWWKVIGLALTILIGAYLVLTVTAAVILGGKTADAKPENLCIAGQEAECAKANAQAQNSQSIPNIFNPADSFTIIFSIASR